MKALFQAAVSSCLAEHARVLCAPTRFQQNQLKKINTEIHLCRKIQWKQSIEDSGHNAVKFSQVKMSDPADFFNATDFCVHKLPCVESLVGKLQTNK